MNDAPKGEYVCCFYETRQQQGSALARFVREGVRLGRRVLLVESGPQGGALRQQLDQEGLEVEKYLDSGQIRLVNSEGLYLQEGRFDPDRALRSLRSEIREATSAGYAGLRVAGDMTWAARGNAAHRLLEFAADLRSRLDEMPLEVLEQYNRSRVDPTFLLDILAAHPRVADDRDVYDNIYYLPRVERFGPEQSSQILTELLDSLVRRKQTENALRQSEEHFRGLVQAAGNPIVVLDSHGRLRQLNEESERLHGVKSDEVVGRDYSQLLFPEHRDEFLSAVRSVLGGQVVRGLELDVRDGYHDRRRVQWTLTPLRDWQQKPQAVVAVGQDITDWRRAQTNVAQAQKLETIGQLAGGIAHHFNNLLTIIMGNAELMQRTLGGESECHHMAEQIVQASQRASDLTTQLLAFARKGRFKVERVDVHELLRRAVQLLSVTIDKRVEIQLQLEASPSFTRGDPGQLENVFLNLCLNARDAMPQGGMVELSTELRDVDQGTADRLDIQPGRYVTVIVTDTGVGMDADTRQRIFEPFFTTKEVGKGAGLGLASVYGCVRNHAGGVEVHSEEGEGTTFRVYLPAVESETPEPPAQAPSGAGRILLVDDEEPVRAFGAKVLRQLGYEVTACANGIEAVETFEKTPRRFDLVILDLVMPKMDGLDTFRRMKEINPEVRAMLSSGFSIGDMPGELLEEGVLDFLAKPYRIEQLSEKVKRAISRRR